MPPLPSSLFPYLTADLPGAAAETRARLEDFEVEEAPLYAPSGAGEHVLFEIEKRDRTTPNAVHRLAQAFGAPEGKFGYAGLKDRAAVTRQWLSVQGVAPERIAGYEEEGLRVLRAARHRNRLQVGHLKGNRFAVVLRGAAEGAEARYGRIAERLGASGVPNYFGEQRFGKKGDSAEVGARMVRGDAEGAVRALLAPGPEATEPGDVLRARALAAEGRWREAADAWPRGYREEAMVLRALAEREDFARALARLPRSAASLYVSAFQSALFNRVVADRIGDLGALYAGDIAYKHENGASFRVEDAAAEQPRADRFEISPSGPLPGKKLLRPSGDPGAREGAILAAAGVDPDRLPSKVCGFALQGERRPLRIPLREFALERAEDGAIRLRFFLPKGSYATAVLREFLKGA